MKKIFLFFGIILISKFSYSQNSSGDRICGNDFSAMGLNGFTLTRAVDYAGKLHNDYQEYVLKVLKEINPNLLDTTTLVGIIQTQTEGFFADKGIPVSSISGALALAKPTNLNYDLSRSQLSSTAKGIAAQFESLIQSYNVDNDASFFNSLNQLKEQALTLDDVKEVIKVGVPISVAQNSYMYWKQKGQTWIDFFSEKFEQQIGLADQGKGGPSEKLFIYFKKPPINLWKIGGADVGGAVSGATSGSVLGPGGALAGGVLTSAVSSLGNLCNQVVSHYVSWWPF